MAVQPQIVHFICFYSFLDWGLIYFFQCFYSAYSPSSSFSWMPSRSSKALNCSVSSPLFSSLTMTPTSTSMMTLLNFLQTCVISLYLLGSMLQVLLISVTLTSSFSQSSTYNSFSLASKAQRTSFSKDILIFISPRATLYRFCMSLMQSRACFLAGWSSLIGKWTSLMASLMLSGVNLRLVVGCTHFSMMILMMSASMLDCWDYRSLSLTCSSPLSRMTSMISFLVLLGKNLLRSAFLATTPCEAFQKISSICNTSDMSSSSPLRQFTALLRQQAIQNCLAFILQRMVATLVILTLVEGCFNIILLLYRKSLPITILNGEAQFFKERYQNEQIIWVNVGHK